MSHRSKYECDNIQLREIVQQTYQYDLIENQLRSFSFQ